MLQIFLLGLALSADAFSIAIAFGMSRITHKMKFKISFLFGFFQFLFPLIGVFAGQKAGLYFGTIAKIAGIIVLTFIAATMLWRAFKEEHKLIDVASISLIGFLLIGLSVSVDALAAGFSLGVYNAKLLLTASIIGMTTFFVTLFGAEIGYKIGGFIGAGAEIIGSILLLIVAGSLYLGLLGG